MDPRFTNQLLAFTAAGAVYQLASRATIFDFGPGTVEPTVEFTLTDNGVGEVRGRVQMVMVDDEFAVATITASTSDGTSLLDDATFTPALRNAFQTYEVNRTIVEMTSDAGSLKYRFHRTLFPNSVSA